MWTAYDPQWLVDLARRLMPESRWLHEALARCVRAQREGEKYVRFVDAANANQPGAEWQFKENIVLGEEARDVILDVLQDGRIGGVEFLGPPPK